MANQELSGYLLAHAVAAKRAARMPNSSEFIQFEEDRLARRVGRRAEQVLSKFGIPFELDYPVGIRPIEDDVRTDPAGIPFMQLATPRVQYPFQGTEYNIGMHQILGRSNDDGIISKGIMLFATTSESDIIPLVEIRRIKHEPLSSEDALSVGIDFSTLLEYEREQYEETIIVRSFSPRSRELNHEGPVRMQAALEFIDYIDEVLTENDFVPERSDGLFVPDNLLNALPTIRI